MAFGEGPLRLPLLVEAAEELFEPVAIRNNVGGYEGEVRERFDEPSWNNPVVRFLDGEGEDFIPRQDRVFGTGALLERMSLALAAAERELPRWLRDVTTEARGGELEKAVFSMW